MNTIKIALKNIEGDVTDELIIKRVKRCDLSNFMKLQRSLLEEFVYNNGSPGATIAENKNWTLIKKLTSLVPVIPLETLDKYMDSLIF